MATSMRFVVAVLLAAVGLTVVVFRPQWLRSIGVDVATVGRVEPFSPIVLESPPEVEMIQRRIVAKTRVIDQLMARELDLFTAAAHFRELDRGSHARDEVTHWGIQGGTEEEKLCRQVILWVDGRGREYASPRELRQRLDELEAALADRLRNGGRIVLP